MQSSCFIHKRRPCGLKIRYPRLKFPPRGARRESKLRQPFGESRMKMYVSPRGHGAPNRQYPLSFTLCLVDVRGCACFEVCTGNQKGAKRKAHTSRGPGTANAALGPGTSPVTRRCKACSIWGTKHRPIKKRSSSA